MAMSVKDLPIEVRLKLVEDLWDSIASDHNKLPLSEAQKAELDRRLDEYETDGDLGEPSGTVLTRIYKSL